jgi:hypothetical protein
LPNGSSTSLRWLTTVKPPSLREHYDYVHLEKKAVEQLPLFNVILIVDDNSLPHRDIFDFLHDTNIDYLLMMNPVLCKSPIV